MPDPVMPTSWALIISGALSSIFTFMFDVPASTVWAGFMGVVIGIVLSDAMTFKKSLAICVLGTICAGLLVPFFMYFAPEMAQKTAGLIVGFTIVKYRTKEDLEDLANLWRRILGKGV